MSHQQLSHGETWLRNREAKSLFGEASLDVAFEFDLKRLSGIPQGGLSSGAFQTEGTSISTQRALGTFGKLGTVRFGWRAGNVKRITESYA